MDPKQTIILASFICCCGGVGVGALLGLLGIWIKDFGEVGMKLFMSDVVVTAAAILIGILTYFFR